MKALIYVRISKDREGAGLGVQRQREDCQALADSLGWTVVDVLTDNDISAFSGRRRPAYEQMLEALEKGKARAVIAWHTDRLHRRPVELESFIDLCDRRNVDVRTVQSGSVDLSTASGRMVARMLGAAARHEVEHSIERQKRAKYQAAIDGKFRGGRRAFGYVDGMTLNDVEAAAIRDASSRVLAGVSLHQISREWNASGLRTSFGGNKFNSREVRKILLRPRNAGLALHDGKVIGDGAWPTIIDKDTLTALEAMMHDPARSKHLSFERKWMGSGVYVCGKCGAKMLTATQAGGRAGRAHTYRCSGGAHMGRVAVPLDEYVSMLVIGRLSRPDARIVLGRDEVDVAALQVRRDAVQARLDELASLFADGAVDGSQLKAGSAKLRIDMAAVTTEIAAARESSVLANLVLAGDDLEMAWKETSPDVRGKIIDALMTVTILPSPRGRQPGGGYFDPQYIQIDWKA